MGFYTRRPIFGRVGDRPLRVGRDPRAPAVVSIRIVSHLADGGGRLSLPGPGVLPPNSRILHS